MSLDAAGELSRTDKRSPTCPPLCRPCPRPVGVLLTPRRVQRPDSPITATPFLPALCESRVPTPVLRASSIIFVQARELESGDGVERATGVAGRTRRRFGK